MAGGFNQRAWEDAALKFAPSRTALSEAILNARSAYGQSVRAGNAQATLLQQAAQQALPQIQGIYGRAQAQGTQDQGFATQALSGLKSSPVVDLYKAVQAAGAAGQSTTRSLKQASDEALIAKQQVAAREGAQFSQQQARTTLQGTLAGLISKSRATAQEQGSFAASEAEKLQSEAEKAERSERQSERSAATTRRGQDLTRTSATESNQLRREAAARGEGPGSEHLTAKEQNEALSTVQAIQHYAAHQLQAGEPRPQVVAKLQAAGPSISGKTKAGQNFSKPGRPAYKPDVLMSAGIDLAEKGGLSKHTYQRLKEAHYKPEHWGLRLWNGKGGALGGVQGEAPGK